MAVTAYRQYLGPGSSGYWGDFGTHDPTGPRPGMGYPGDRGRISAGVTPLDPTMRPIANQFQQGGYGTGASSPLFGGGGNNFGGPQQQQQPGFNTLSNVKSPTVQGAINNAFSSLQQTNSFNPNVNPNVVRDNVKNPALQAASNNMAANLGAYTNPTDFTKSGQFQQGIDQGYGQAATDKQNNRAQFDNFQQLFNSQTPEVTNNVNQENAALGNWWGTGAGSVTGQLQNNLNQWSQASKTNTQNAINQVMKNNALLRMTQGDGSYATSQAMNSAGLIAAQQAQQAAELGRNNIMTVLAGQGQYGGIRDRNLDYLSNRQMVPINLRNQLGAAEDSRLAGLGSMDLSNNIYTTPAEQGAQRAALLGQLSSVDNANNFYTLDSPQANLARQLSALGQLSQINNANNFYGLSTPYQPNNQGYFNQSSFSAGPGGGKSTASNNLQISPTPVTSPALTANNLTGGAVQGNGAVDALYQAQTGFLPSQDPNFSPQSYAALQQMSQGKASMPAWVAAQRLQQGWSDPWTNAPAATPQTTMIAGPGDYDNFNRYARTA